MRISEIQNPRRCEVSLFRDEGGRHVTIFLYIPKNDQFGAGVSRTWSPTSNAITIVGNLSKWLFSETWGPDIEELVFPENTRNLVETILEYSAIPNHIHMGEVSSHSLRSGGDTSLPHVGVDMMEIQKWGRWGAYDFEDIFGSHLTACEN